MKRMIGMMAAVLSVAAALTSSAAPAKPGAKGEFVVDGFPAWTGVTEKNYVYGRKLLGPEDLRHKVLVVVEFESEKFKEQIGASSEVVAFASKVPDTTPIEGVKWPRERMVLFTGRGKLDVETFKSAVRSDAGFKSLNGPQPNIAVYQDVTFEGAPDAGGKYPHVYVMAPTGVQPEAKFPGFKASDTAEMRKIVKKLDSKTSGWREFYGYCAEPKHFPQLEKALSAGKPLGPVVAAIEKGLKSKDAEAAKEAQMLHDAIVQTRSDLLARIKYEASKSPARAICDKNRLVTLFPQDKKNLGDIDATLKKFPEAPALAKMLEKVLMWSDPVFVPKSAGDAKKIVAELEKMKKTLPKLTESQTIGIQNAALYTQNQIDGLISEIPLKAPAK